jgi:NADH:ubiquinone oxidoreductase subunit B-like Fe-S oxidoreductase
MVMMRSSREPEFVPARGAAAPRGGMYHVTTFGE